MIIVFWGFISVNLPLNLKARSDWTLISPFQNFNFITFEQIRGSEVSFNKTSDWMTVAQLVGQLAEVYEPY